MRFAIVAALLTTLAGGALAEDRAPLRSRPGRDRHLRDRGPRDPADVSRMCTARRNVLATEQTRYEGFKSELVGIDSELAQLRTRIDQLRRQREETKRNLAYAEERYKGVEQDYARECRAGEDCTSYDTQAAQLDQQTSVIEGNLEAVRDEIRTNRGAIAALERGIAPLQREYNDKRCNALVPGETEQSVIERCMGIFSEWNRMQSELNRQNARVPDLRSRYEQLFSELKALEARASNYETYLSRNCTSSPQIVKMRGFEDRRVRARTVGEDLDQLVSDITRVRGVKILVQAR